MMKPKYIHRYTEHLDTSSWYLREGIEAAA